jgi:pimeloyl-ACP methyl ester carboxylesterase
VSTRATEVVFLPGFDGAAELRHEFVATLAQQFPARGMGYPNRTLGSLDAYWQHVAPQVPQDARVVVIGESFSGMVAARWAASDPRVAAIVLCGAFARNPLPLVVPLAASMPATVKFIGANFMNPFLLAPRDPRRRWWIGALRTTFGGLHRDVVAERLRLIATQVTGPDLAALRIPVTLLQFEADLVVRKPARRHLESVCHNARIMRLPGPHFALETRPLECARAIADGIAPLFV